MKPLLRIENLTAGYGESPILHDLDFTIGTRERVGLIGPNGAGKTSVLRAIFGQLACSRGAVALGGDSITVLGPRRIAQRVSLVPQDASRTFSWTVEDWVGMGRYCHLGPLQAPGPRDREIIVQSLERLDLGDFRHRTVDTLSGGEWQRVQLARAFAQGAPLMLLDEPTNHLDLQHQVALFRALLDSVTTDAFTFLAVLHDLNHARTLCDRILLIDQGRLVAEGSPEQVLRPDILEPVYQVQLRQGERDGFLYPENLTPPRKP